MIQLEATKPLDVSTNFIHFASLLPFDNTTFSSDFRKDRQGAMLTKMLYGAEYRPKCREDMIIQYAFLYLQNQTI